MLAVHADVARAIAKEIQINLAPNAELRLARVRAVDPEVEDEYLKGRFHWHERGASLRQAVVHYRRALELDPNFAPAWAGMASAFSIFDIYQLEPAPEASAKAEAAARRALELDASNAEALAALGMVKLSKELDLSSGLRQIHQAVELDPSDVFVRTRLASVLGAVGRFGDADAHFLRARELDPLSAAVRYMHADNYLNSGDPGSAIREYGSSLELGPNMVLSRRGLGWAYILLGDLDRAEEEFARLGSNDSVGSVGLAWISAQRGDREMALRWVSKVQNDELALPDVARLYAFLGEPDRAFEALDLAFTKQAPTLAWVLVAGIQGRNELSALRDDPRFKDLASRVRLPEGEPAP